LERSLFRMARFAFHCSHPAASSQAAGVWVMTRFRLEKSGQIGRVSLANDHLGSMCGYLVSYGRITSITFDFVQRSNATQPMKPHRLPRRLVDVLLLASFAVTAQAGTFKRISIDGSFSDWAGVPSAYNDASETTAGADFRQVYLANDERYLYIRFTLYALDSP